MLTLTTEERAWLEAYRSALEERFPGQVERLIIYGSKARGDAGLDSDLDVLMLIRAGDWRLKKALSLVGYDLAVGTDVVPSIQVYTFAEWSRLEARQSVFREAIEREGVSVR